MKKILVTGGCGFIGSHTCLALIERNYEIWVVDSLINSSPVSLERIKKLTNKSAKIHFFKGDLRDISFIRELFLKAKNESLPISGVIHFAGLKAVEESIFNPLKYWDANVIGTVNLIRVMEENNCRSIVFSSSATLYYVKDSKPIKESSKINSINPYGTTKLVIEKLLNDLYLSLPDKWRICSLRYFNPIGAHSSGLIGEDPLGKPTNVFPLIMQVAIGQIPKLHIYGNDWPTKDGTGVRDYIHVLDVANGHISALELLFNQKPQSISLNLGTGKGTSVLDLISTFEKINNVKIPFEYKERRKGDYCTVIADNSLARSVLDWSPTRDLEEMCRDGWKWQTLNPKGYN